MDDVWTRQLRIDASHPAFDGHFPGQPILPGVALVAEVIESALDESALAASLGPTPRLVSAKFFVPVAPGSSLLIVWRRTAKSLDWRVKLDDRDVASGQFARVDSPAST